MKDRPFGVSSADLKRTENDQEMSDVPIEDTDQKALLNQMIIVSHLVRKLAEKDAYLNSFKEERAEALAEIERLNQRISELAGAFRIPNPI
jgi:hypothetical protein